MDLGTEYAKSKAQPVALMFAESSPANESIHFSFQQRDGNLNCRIPAKQLSAMIENLERVRDVMENANVDTGRGNILIPAAPYGFFD